MLATVQYTPTKENEKCIFSYVSKHVTRFYSEGVSKMLLGKFGTRLPNQSALGPRRPQYRSKILYFKLFF